ncbi:MAG TPA: TonB family protein [Allosphingosinicella sp.]|nr:TonB family protein [Allosphingosinicella sp.]
MYANGFFEQQQRRSPFSFALVVALHAAGFGALILAGSTQFIQQDRDRIVVRPIPIPPDPPLVQPEPEPEARSPERRDTVLTPIPPIRETNDNDVVIADTVPRPPVGQQGEQTVTPPRPDPLPDPPPPVRREAQLDPRYARDLQPPYPAPELRAERSGVVRIRLTIAPSGRVTTVQRLSATNDNFWRATEQQALRHWRFRPATLDGRPVQGVKEMTVRFRIQDAV